MKKLLKNICCLALVTTMIGSSVTVFAYTTDELNTISKSNEAVTLYALGNKDLEYYVSKSFASSTASSTIKYESEVDYKNAGAKEGRRSGITTSIAEYYDTKFPSEENAVKALSKVTDETILKENKIGTTDPFASAFLRAYKDNFVDAYSIAEYELAGYYFGELRAESELLRYFNYTTKPSVSDLYETVKGSIFTSYGVKATDNYATYFEAAFKKGFELTYTKEDEGYDLAYVYGRAVGFETASRITSDLKEYEDFDAELDRYKNSSAYRVERSNFIIGLSSSSNTEISKKYDEGFEAGVEEFKNGNESTGDETSSEEGILNKVELAGNIAGYEVGAEVAEVYAKNHFINHKPYDVDVAYLDYTNTVDINLKYRLDLLPLDYQNGFMSGLVEGFYISYQTAYLELQNNKTEVSTYVQLPTQGDLFAEYVVKAPSTDLLVDFTLDFGYGNFFNESFVKVYDNGRFWEHDATRYTAYSNSYNVEVYSNISGVKQNYITLKQPMIMSFTHDLGENVGIYKVVGNQLRYIHTEVDYTTGDRVYATIPAGKYFGGTYVLLADEKMPVVNDIKNNWNYSGLDTYSRRGWLPTTAQGYAKPENNITRAQFAFMLERNVNKNNELVVKPVDYADENKFYGYNNAINYCVSKGYLTVDSENKFRPLDTISYAEVESVLQRVLGYNVAFSTVDGKMQSLNFHKSKYSSNKNSKITISETVFTLLDIFQ